LLQGFRLWSPMWPWLRAGGLAGHLLLSLRHSTGHMQMQEVQWLAMSVHGLHFRLKEA
jgi:hypothetical protein